MDVALKEGSRLNDLLRALLDRGVSIRSCDRIESDLEAAFSRILEAEENKE